MSDINQITIIGNLTRDPELRHTQNGKPVTEFTIGSNQTWSNGDMKEKKTTFINCTAWGKAAENIVQYVKKGHRLGVTGKLDQDNWDDKETGQKRTKHFITVREAQFLNMKVQNIEGETGDTQGPDSNKPFSDDDIPFAPNVA